MIQFYAPEISKVTELGPEESVHCARVLRKKAGDKIFVTDGKGIRYECEIEEASTKRTTFKILSQEEIRRGWNKNITLAVAPTKNSDRMSWLVEKAVELGIDNIVFLKTVHSERKNINLDRLRKVAVSAMNQSLKTILPRIEGPVDINQFVKSGEGRKKLFGYCDEEIGKLDIVNAVNPNEDIILMIGPEGDFSKSEVELLKQYGFTPVTLGDERLRTETAAIYGLTAIHILDRLPC